MKLIIYMPAYNEEEQIQQVLQNLPRSLEGISQLEYLVIDDGSIDRTAQLARECGAEVVSHGRNRGVGSAFHSAVEFALGHGADILVGIDADGQFDSSEICALIAPILAKQADLVIGNRFHSGMPENMSPVKYWGNQRVARLVSAVCGQQFADVSCGFRAYDREALFRLNIFGKFTYTHETILSLSYQDLKIVDYPIRVKYFPERKSRVAGSITNYAVQTSKIILRVLLDYRPIRVFGAVGAGLILAGILCGLFLLGHYVLTQTFTPYKNIGFIGLGLVVSGLLVLIIALVADMLNRIRMNQDKVLYEIKKIRYEK